MAITVNIVPSEGPGWIMGRIVRELSERNGWPVNEFDASADINYFVNYHAAKKFSGRKLSTVTAAWFTHPEKSEFFTIADSIDIRICHAPKYAKAISGHVITPGIDEIFSPRLRMGVVGRTYESGRKGEFLLEALSTLNFVDIVSPPSLIDSKDENAWLLKLREFYASIDALLVTSLVEGGPIPAAEATACGVPVIGPADVGNLELLSIISYTNGSVESLIKVLTEFSETKMARSKLVASWSWGNFAERNRVLLEAEFNKIKSKD